MLKEGKGSGGGGGGGGGKKIVGEGEGGCDKSSLFSLVFVQVI